MLWRNRTFLLLMTGEVIAGAGMWISIIANLQFMQHMIPSDTVKGLILMSGLIVSILLSPKAGVMIDGYDKGKIMLYASLVRCLSPICMLPAIYYGSLSWMVVSLVIMQVSAAFYFPTVQSSLPAILSPADLLKANSVYLNLSTLSRIGGTAIGGILVANMDLSQLYLFSLAAYLALAFVTRFLRIPAVDSRKRQEKVEFREVLTVTKKDPALMVALLNTGLITLFLGGFNLLVLNFSEIQQSPELMGWIYTVEGMSILAGGLLAKRWIGGRNLIAASTVLLFFFALSQYGMSFADSRFMVLASFGVFGFTVAFFFPVTTTIFQRRLPEHQQGRFFSFKGMLDRGFFLVALGTTGICLDLFGVSGYMLGIGSVTLLMAALTMVYSKKHKLDVRETDEPAVA
ncbi:MFS transporter [Brevibacillus borstelensis]|uniref:MFS transporter n=1 Tax=Brevibacillus borstelensis TaxID=45462 RepID=UPI000F09251D|nr:MFS transporter [Brevibacillus borstelensis]MED1882821.1 MFS transporter [Brevibacillus borstelensis]RNB60104.1 MFS transporter [Brevibacillus borstelensis]GED52902.1 MFS transporter [Brevibacillus borstelensis]